MKKILLLLLFATGTIYSGIAQEVPQTQKIVISKIGATWCPNCGLTAWDQFDRINEEYADKAVILSLHPSGSSKLHSTESREFTQNLPQAFGQPLFFVDKTKHATGSIVQNAGQAIAAAENISPLANTGITATLKENTLEVNAKVKFFKDGDGEYYLSLLIVEDEVIEDQASRGDNVSHKKILRSSLFGGTFGQAFANGTVSANSEITFKDSKELDPSWNTEQLEVAAIIWQKIDDKYEFINAHSVNASFSTSVNFLEATGVSLAVNPTLLQTSASIQIETPIALEQASLVLFNTNGQLIESIFDGKLTSGNHTFKLQKNDLLTSGIYFLQLEDKGGIISKKIVVE